VRQDWSPCINAPIKDVPRRHASSGGVQTGEIGTSLICPCTVSLPGFDLEFDQPEALELTDIALATCSLLPNLDADEQLLIPELASLGLRAEPRIWDDQSVSWGDFRAVVVRSTWDYADRRDAFLAWGARPRQLMNSLPVIRWNTDKRYLRELSARGVPVVPTTWIDPHQAGTAFDLPDGPVVVKPSISAGARNTSRYGGDGAHLARLHVERLLAEGRSVMVQPYVASVDSDGETGLIYIDGEFSHAIRKGPVLHAPGIATEDLWAPEDISSRDPGREERAVAEVTLDELPWPRRDLVYARVDIVRGDGDTPMLLELELAEPSLFLGFGNRAPALLAAAIARRLDAATG
jgi:glutathione synthase/RimK-type ligase-like ATP-grasp enzyme